MMNNKRIIIFGVFLLVLMLLVYFTINNNGLSYFNRGEIVANNETNEEVAVADSSNHCKTEQTTCSYNCSAYTYLGSRPSNCRSNTPTGCIDDRSFYVSCTATGGVPCTKTETKKCTSCDDGYYLTDTGKCEAITVDSVSGGGTVYLAADEDYTFDFTASSDPADASGFSPDWSLSLSAGATGSADGASYSLTASGNGKGSGSSCKKTTYTVTASFNGTSASASAIVCKYCSKWRGPISAKIYSRTKRNTEKPNQGCYYYEGEQEVDGGYLYTAYYTRCCSSPTSDFGACYGNKKYLGIATDVEWQNKESTARPYKYSGVSEADCHVINVNVCSAKPTSPLPTTKNTDKCEDSQEITYKDTTKCSNYEDQTESNFYTIECDRKISTSFDYDDDNDTNSNRVLYKGGGFGFGIKVTSIHTCTAKFNKDTWMDVYNKYLKKIGFISSSLVDYVKNYDYDGWVSAVNKLDASTSVKSEVFELWNTLKGLRDLVVNDYVGFKPENKYDEQAKLILEYKVNDVSKEQEEDLVISEQDYKEGSYTKTVSSTKYDLTRKLKNVPEYFVLSNENDPRVVKLIPKHTYIEKYLGKGVNNDSTNIDGGNKIYVDFDIDPTETGVSYPIKITLSGLGSNSSKVINNKCDIKVSDEEILYRPIDISNPFINNNWNIGQNWLSSKYSFTNTIKSNIWSSSGLLNIDLTSDEIDSIKESNKTFIDKYPYLGLCDRINSNSQDKITSDMCKKITKAIDQFQ